MSPERWRQVEALFNAAVEHKPDHRERFLAEACGVDTELRQQVDSLLKREGSNEGVLDRPAWEAAPSLIENSLAALIPGTQLGCYKILAPIGAGGMGEVYRAIDTRLKREVALKVLPDSFANDPDRLARFEREARVLASLNHPNIAQIYGVEDRALVMELVPGETLASRLKPGSLPLETALNYAKQIAEALEAAHEKGIIHRDLKPANVKVTPGGVVKVLDFGLAKAAEESTGTTDATNSPTLTGPATRAGMILGTAAYMSPEQASGSPVDRRADIWSFGVVLWELLTGQRLFRGESVTQTLAEVLRGPIDFNKLPRETPAPIRGLLRRCLDRNVKTRLRDIGEARIAIEAVLAGEPPLEGAPHPGSARRLWLAWSVAAALAVSLTPIVFVHFRERPPAQAPPVRFQIPVPANATVGFSLSPDGRKLAFMAGTRLWVHSLESGESRDLTETDHGPFWSADSRFIGYVLQGKLKKIAADGGAPQTVADFTGVWGNGEWNRDDVIIFADRLVGLFRVPASGGVPVQITTLDPARHENSQCCPSFLLDGRHFVYLRASTDEGKSAIYLGSVDAKPEQQSSKPLVTSHSQALYAASADPGAGYLLFVREGTLMAQQFDNRRLKMKGQAAPLAEQVSDNRGSAIYEGFAASANDVLVFQGRAAPDMQLTWFDREGRTVGTTAEPGYYENVVLSPDGTRLAVVKMSGADASNIWLLDLSRRGAGTRLTFVPGREVNPLWSPDGSRIIFSSKRGGSTNLYEKSTNGVRDEEVVLKSSEDKLATSWSRDGRFLLYTVVHPKTKNDIWILSLHGGNKPMPFLVTEFNERQARFSPDGHWVAYTSDESGQDEVYVRSFSMNSAGTAVEAGAKWPISNGYGVDPRWRADGRELYYLSRGGGLMAVEITTNPAFRAGNAQPLGPLTFAFGNSRGTLEWDSAADGKRFLRLATKGGPQPYTVVLNWQASLKK